MNDIERKLREALFDQAERVEPPGDFDDRVVRRVVSRRTRRRNVLVTASGALVAVAAVAAVLVARHGPDDDDIVVTDIATTTTSSTEPSTTESIVEPSTVLSLDGPRQRTQSLWTGEEIVIWGGYVEASNSGVSGSDRALVDGAAFNPTHRTWRLLSPSPLRATSDNTLSVWAGDRAVFVRGNDVAAWLPQPNQWQTLPALPGPVAAGKLVWTGSEIIAVDNNVALGVGDTAWRALSEPPLRIVRGTAHWTGSVLLVTGRGPGADPLGAVHLLQYDPRRDVWELPPASATDATASDAAWNGKELVVVNYDNSGSAYDPILERWRNLMPVPARFYEHFPRVFASGAFTVAFMGQTIAVLDDRHEWTPLPYGDFKPTSEGIVVADDGTIWSIGIDPREPNGFAAASINPTTALAALKAVQVGVATLDMGEYTFQSARFDGLGSIVRSTTVRLTTPGGGCVVTSTYVNTDTTRTGTPMRITTAGNREIAARRVTPTAVEVDYTTTDIVRVECHDAPTTTNVLRQLHPPATTS